MDDNAKNHKPAPFESVKRSHVAMAHRLRKSLYCSHGGKQLMDIPSLPLTEVSVDLFQEAVKKGTAKGTQNFDVEYASRVSRKTCVSPCSLMLALIYVERLKSQEPEYLRHMSSCDVFLVSLLVASKYLFDDGEEEEVINEEWALHANIELKTLNKLERQFLSAIDWNVFVEPSLFFQYLSIMETLVVRNECRKRCWNGLNYAELIILMDNSNFFEEMKLALVEYFVKAILVSTLTYAAIIISVVGSVVIVSTYHGVFINHVFVKPSAKENLTSTRDIFETPFSDIEESVLPVDSNCLRLLPTLSSAKQAPTKDRIALIPEFTCPSQISINFV